MSTMDLIQNLVLVVCVVGVFTNHAATRIMLKHIDKNKNHLIDVWTFLEGHVRSGE